MPEFGLAPGDEQLVSPGEGRSPFLPASSHTGRPDLGLPWSSFARASFAELVEATAWPWSAAPGRTDDSTAPSSAPSEHSVDRPRTAPGAGVSYAVQHGGHRPHGVTGTGSVATAAESFTF